MDKSYLPARYFFGVWSNARIAWPASFTCFALLYFTNPVSRGLAYFRLLPDAHDHPECRLERSNFEGKLHIAD